MYYFNKDCPKRKRKRKRKREREREREREKKRGVILRTIEQGKVNMTKYNTTRYRDESYIVLKNTQKYNITQV